MNTPSEEPTLHELLSRLAELEQAHARLQEELTHVRAERAPAAEEQASTQTRTHPKRSSRRKVLEKGLGVAVATVGAGTLLELSSGTASASIKPGVFASSVAGTPAVSATGTNGADGVDATSDSGVGVSAQSSSGIGLHAVGGGASPGTPPNGLTEMAVFAEGGPNNGIVATCSGIQNGVFGISSGISGDGVFGISSGGNGVAGESTSSSGSGVVGAGATGVTGTGSFIGVRGISGTGVGVSAQSSSGIGVSATSGSGTALVATSSTGLAAHFVGGNVNMDKNLTVTGTLSSGAGALASSVSGTPAVKATGTNGADGVDASSDSGIGVSAKSTSGGGPAVKATGSNGADGVDASSDSGFGVSAKSTSGIGLVATSISGAGGSFSSGSGKGVTSSSNSDIGVDGFSGSNAGVRGLSSSGIGVFGESLSGDGVFGSIVSTSVSVAGVHGRNTSSGLAGLFDGNVQVNGNLSVSGTVSKGGGSFKIDHPLDPAHKYLSHSFVESPDMKNIYDGVVTLDGNGEAEVRLPAWFDALNTEFRYQLTAIGASAPDLYIAEEISGDRFKIAGGQAGMKVSWLVTGIRQDAWANAHRIPVEQDKPAEEQGSYLYPELYGQPEQPRAGALL